MAGAGIYTYLQQWPPAESQSPPVPDSSVTPQPPPAHHLPPVLVENQNLPPYDEGYLFAGALSGESVVTAGAGIYTYHQQWPPAEAPPPSVSESSVSPQPPPAHHPPSVLVENQTQPPYDELRTIFIAGLPEDVKERELQNLLRWLAGYEASQVTFKEGKPMGFALFSEAHLAISAKDVIQDLVFDAQSKSVLHARMAKKNLFVKRGIVTDSNDYEQSKRLRTGDDYTQSAYSSSHFQPPPHSVWGAPQEYVTPTPPAYDPYGGHHLIPVPVPAPAPVPTPSCYAPIQNIKDNPPCNTLFIGNLGENVNEEELRGLIIPQPGFKQMKILRHKTHTVCFIEFEDVNSATNVHHNLQGAVIPSSGSVGMRIQYSKNPFGKRKNGTNHHPAPAYPSANVAQQTIGYPVPAYPSANEAQQAMLYSVPACPSANEAQ